MNYLCPRCGIQFEREPGYFTGAYWIFGMIFTPIALGFMFVLVWQTRIHIALIGLLASLIYIPLGPITLRFSRSLWMYFDHQMNPQRMRPLPPDSSSGSSPLIEPPAPAHGIDIPGTEPDIITSTGEPLRMSTSQQEFH